MNLTEEQNTNIKKLQDELKVGLQSGEPRPFDFDAFKILKHNEHAIKSK